MTKGYFGKVLWIDLSTESFKEEEISDEVYKQYLGGYGLGCKLISENMASNTDPLSENSILGFFPGLFTGTMAPLSGRYMVVGKSPLTGGWGDSNSGGTFGPEIKKCGYDGILIKGIANNPKFVIINEGEKEILDASDLWGLDIIETEEKLKQRYGKFIKTALIGQAGENLSLISGVANDKGRIAARSGLGAIMGSKNLKCLVLKGKKKIPIHNREDLIKYTQIYNEAASGEPGRILNYVLKKLPNMAKMVRRLNMDMAAPAGLTNKIYKKLGTCVGNTIAVETGDTPVKNWAGIGMYDYPFEKSKKLSANNIIKYKKKEYGCYSCPVRCGGILEVPELGLEETHQPEYETCAAFGAMLLNDDLDSIFIINELCNRAAIDTISTGCTISFAIECYENGILTKDDTNGLELNWGNSEAIIELVKKIINREGIGDILADGAKKASERIGKGSERYSMTSLGQEIAMHSPKAFESLAFSYAYDPTPGRHTTASVDFYDTGSVDDEKFIKGFKFPEGWKDDIHLKIKAQKLTSCITQVTNSLGLCMFTSLFGQYPVIEMIHAFTGWDINLEQLLKIGHRIQTLRQSFTLREGVKITENKLPNRTVGIPPDEKGPNEGISIEYEAFYKGYCEEMGWNPKNGYPLEETLKDLDLEFIIKDLY
ncbi:MAG: aldehyde ferredoxin oxidoreductase [Candidatus Lokiarchaeota archaeon]|nr:aldehyde ferredoxin oxidoreductase [Candidatus Lokiarchaeota archaeon]MBD3201058.1 aldehyde ferredoxin oxidoreductase [Candidatus Lokiarchaeota archaeon]